MEIKASQAKAFLSRLDPAIRTILLFGPDQGLVAERAAQLISQSIGATDDPFAIVTLDGGALASDPARLADSAHALSLFGGKRAVRVRGIGQRSIIPALEPLLATPPTEAIVVIEAGDLRKTAPLRKLCAAASSAASIGCYGESDADLDRLITEEVTRHGLRIGADARIALRRSIGADRLQSRAEIAKLCLYVGEGEVGPEDVRAIVADASQTDVDDVLDFASLGRSSPMVGAWRQVIAEGTNPGSVAGAALRHFQGLQRARAMIGRGANMGEAIGAMHLPMTGPRRDAIERQIGLWPAEGIERALARIGQALAESRLKATLALPIVSSALLGIALEASRLSRQRR